jgi:diadenosine tetraphosphate (Ap4A) HIT family hydrolase
MNWRNDRIGSAVQGLNPTVIARMKSGFAVIGDTQFLPGYCVLLGCPRVPGLNDLPTEERVDFLLDMSLIGDAVMSVCKPARVNYEILGNTDAFLHAHIFPRYHWEEESRRRSPVWLYPGDRWVLADYQYDEARHGELKSRLMAALAKVMEMHYR